MWHHHHDVHILCDKRACKKKASIHSQVNFYCHVMLMRFTAKTSYIKQLSHKCFLHQYYNYQLTFTRTQVTWNYRRRHLWLQGNKILNHSAAKKPSSWNKLLHGLWWQYAQNLLNLGNVYCALLQLCESVEYIWLEMALWKMLATLRDFSCGHWGEPYRQSPCRTVHTDTVSVRYGNACVSQELTVVWMLLCTGHTCMDAPLYVYVYAVSYQKVY